MSAVSPPTASGPDRRSVLLLGLGAGAALVAGCSLNNPYTSDEKPPEEVVRDLEPDVGLAVEAVGLIHRAAAETSSALAHSPDLGARLAGLAAAYAAYLEVLEKAVPDGVETGLGQRGSETPPASRAQALQRARRAAGEARTGLTEIALRAESGAFARLLGSMGAGLSQRLAVLR